MKQRDRDLKTSCRIAVPAAASVCRSATALSASPGRMVTLDERFNGAEAVGVAAVRRVAAESRQNALGDRLIVSLIERAAEEPLDGGAARSRWMGMEGGTEGEGILTLDDRDVVHGTTTTLNDIQSRARRLGQ